MPIVIESILRERFRLALLRHRSGFTLNDADYVTRVLKVSLNTYKKCLQTQTHEALRLSANTFRTICQHAGLDPSEYGFLPLSVEDKSHLPGFYRSDFGFMCGRFALYRRSLLNAQNIVCNVLEILTNDRTGGLFFRETLSYMSDRGVRHEQTYEGDIHMDRDRALIGLPAYFGGQVRLTLLMMPDRPIAGEGIKMRGALLTHGRPKGFWQPTVASVYVEGPCDAGQETQDICRTIARSDKEFEHFSAELAGVERHVTIDTTVMWERSQSGERERL